MAEREHRPVIGKASATESAPNTSENFSFWLTPRVVVNPFDIVEAEQPTPKRTSHTYGIVPTLEHFTDVPTHLTHFISSNFGEVGEPVQTQRQGTTVARVAVLSNDREIYMHI